MNTLEHLIEIPKITIESTARECIDVMMDVECFNLPVLKDGQPYGSVTMDDCMVDETAKVEKIVEAGFPIVHVNSHLFDVMRVMRESQSPTCAIVDDKLMMLGIITKDIVVNRISHSITIGQVGAILILEIVSYQYSSSEFDKIV